MTNSICFKTKNELDKWWDLNEPTLNIKGVYFKNGLFIVHYKI